MELLNENTDVGLKPTTFTIGREEATMKSINSITI